MFSEFKLALSFLSRIPIQGKGKVRNVPAYFTLVGYVAGTFYFISKLAIPSFPWQILAISVGFFLFDLFHFDGFLDTLDGFLSQKSQKRKIEIMSMGNVGPSALFYGTLFVMTYVYLFFRVDTSSVFYMSVFGRLSMNFMLDFSPPAKEKGLGRVFHPYHHRDSMWSLLFSLPLLFEFKVYMISAGMTFLTAYGFSKLSNKEIGGYTGDVLGACNMLTQLLVLLGIFTLKGVGLHAI